MGKWLLSCESTTKFFAPQAIIKGVATALNGLGGLVFPALCAGCDRPVSQTGTLCGTCWRQVSFLEMPYCPVMGTPFTHDFGAQFLCAEAIADPPPFRRLRSVALHGGSVRYASVSLKYHDRLDLAPWMARWMLRAGHELLRDCDVIIPVPLHRRRLWQRRYNQAAELARALGHKSGRHYEPAALQRIKHTHQQASLSRKERQGNVAGAFVVPETERIKVQGRSVLLVDDVYTTGATAKAATRALIKAGACSVDVLTFSRVLPSAAKE
ncbi:ComF family protein [Pseudochrobactrum sp. HB0163]|uniref:ComF family protein n=1 Tax=Pseudochrobactrum sp. HB0163 TaxID=3450708 RepID=UPI003F6E3294